MFGRREETRLAEKGITGRTYFNAREGLLIVWLEKPGAEPEEVRK